MKVRGKDGVAVILNNRLKECVKINKCMNSRIIWLNFSIGIEIQYGVIICIYGLTDDRGKKWISV